MALEIPRDNSVKTERDRYKGIIPPGGGEPVAYRRCTSFIDVLEDKSGLEMWGQRMVAIGLSKTPDLLALASTASPEEDKQELNSLCWKARDAAGAGRKSNIGKALHKLTEKIDQGLTPEIAPMFEREIQAYIAATKHITKAGVELFVVCDSLAVGGTLDRLVMVNGEGYIADLKTGDDILSFGSGKIAMQLALYSRSCVYNKKTGERSPLVVNQDIGFVYHLPQGQGVCKTYKVDLQAGWQGVQLAAEVWKWRERKGLLTPVAA